MKETLHAIHRASDNTYYTHGYPGSWDDFPKLQLYKSKSAATRQANKLKNCCVVQVAVEEIGDQDEQYLRDILPRVEFHAHVVVSHEFATMVNPKYRGPNWHWSKFVEFAARSAKVSAWQGYSDEQWTKFGKNIEKDVYRIAKTVAESVMESSGILDWWPVEGR